MITYTQARNLLTSLTGSSTSTTLDTLMVIANETARELASMKPWPFLEATRTTTTTDGTQCVDIPHDLRKVQAVTVTSGTSVYHPMIVTAIEDWHTLNSTSGIENDTPSYFFPYGNQVCFYPTAATTGNTITFRGILKVKDISVADYTSGTITTATLDSTSITGSGTSWTAAMAGRWFRITQPTGDHEWYQIASVTNATTLVLERPYTGTSIVAGAAGYTIGETWIIPEEYQMLPLYRALNTYFASMQPEPNRAQEYKALYSEGLKRMQGDAGSLTTSVVL